MIGQSEKTPQRVKRERILPLDGLRSLAILEYVREWYSNQVMSVTTLPSLSIFFPAYNEEPNLQKLIETTDAVARSLTDTYELLVIDDGSTDGTVELVKKLKRHFPQLSVISHPKNAGYGAALKTGIAASHYEWIFFTDADLQFDVTQLHELVPWTATHQIILGWRESRADGARRAFNAKLFKAYVDMLYRVHVRDIDCAFKLMKREVVQSVPLESSSAFTTSELLYKLKKKGIKFKELPVHHFPRYRGTQTGANFTVILKACWEALRLYTSIKWHSLRA